MFYLTKVLIDVKTVHYYLLKFTKKYITKYITDDKLKQTKYLTFLQVCTKMFYKNNVFENVNKCVKNVKL